MFYTRKGDRGTTSLCVSGVNGSVSKGSYVVEALGNLDELNSFLGWCRVRMSRELDDSKEKYLMGELRKVQEYLFVIQAEIGGGGDGLVWKDVEWLESNTDRMEKIMPPIRSFCVPGGSEDSAIFDVARTCARRAERSIVKAKDTEHMAIGEASCAYLNRLSSFLYAVARLLNYRKDIVEEPPCYPKILPAH